MNSPATGEEAARLKRQGSEQAIQLALESKWEEAAALNRTILAAHPAGRAAASHLIQIKAVLVGHAAGHRRGVRPVGGRCGGHGRWRRSRRRRRAIGRCSA